jgi:uncharacterized membrane protein
MNEWFLEPFGKHWTDFLFMFLFFVAIVAIVVYCIKKYKIGFPQLKPFGLIILSYLLTGSLFGQFYSAMYYFNPNSFDNIKNGASNWDFTYYSFTIMTSLGPTDITPVTYLAKWTSLVEAGVSLFFLSVLISLLLSKIQENR